MYKKSKLKYAEKLKFIPDKVYISLVYWIKEKKIMHWRNPRLLNEKLQALKICNRNPLYTKLVDKLEVKDIIQEKLGSSYIIPTLGEWNRAEDIPWKTLPDRFVLKCTHDSHSVVIVDNKNQINKKEVTEFLNGCLKKNLYWLMREWPYKNVKPRIIAEKYISNSDGTPMADYKFYCYGGKPQYFMYSVGEADHNVKNHKFNMKLESIDYLFKEKAAIEFKDICLPDNINQMINIVTALCKNMPHVRIDLFNVDGHIYFGEFTFFSGGGFIHMKSDEYSAQLANLIDLKQGYNWNEARL